MATSPNFGWLEPDNTDLVKNGALAIRTAVNAIDASLAELKGGTTGQVLSKTSNTDMDFTWVAQDDSNAIQNAIVDAKGDLIAATAADTPARLAVGSNTQVLTADSTASTGLAWALRGGQTLLSTTTLSGTSTTISGIPTTYQDLRIIVRNIVGSTSENYNLRLNGDSGGNYYTYAIQTATSVATGDNGLTTGATLGFITTSTTAHEKSSLIIDIPRYNDTSNCSGVSISSQIGYGQPRFYQNSFRYNDSAGITSVTFYTASGSGTFTSGTVYIYGVN